MIGLVLLSNVQCAVAFLIRPEVYAPGFELAGAVGAGMVRGMGILFLMWNVPYAFAAWNPVTRRVSLVEAILMQAIGFAGEAILQMTLPREYATAHQSIWRFILFDGAGLLFLILAWWITRRHTHRVDRAIS